MPNFNLAYIQADLQWEDKEANFKHFSQLLEQVTPGTDLILLPETFTTAFPVDPKKYAEKEDGKTMQWLQNQAQKKDSVICATFPLEKDGHYYNSLVWMRPDGSYELYFKRHTFTMGGEDKLVERGEKQLIVELKGWKIKPMVCYDIRFPVWARNRYENGVYEYDLGFYLANFPDSRMNVWNTLLQARAIENQAYWIGVNRVGEDNDGLHYSGESQVVNARGEVISKAEPYQETVLHCTLEIDPLLHFRKKFPLGPDWDEFEITEPRSLSLRSLRTLEGSKGRPLL